MTYRERMAYESNTLGLQGEELKAYLENVGGTPGRDKSRRDGAPNWRNRFYGLPDRYDPGISNGIKAINKILWQAAKRAKKAKKEVK